MFAHAVGVSCTIRGAQVEVEAYYDDDSPAIKAMVQVLNAKNEVIATGDTDEKGRWVFAKPGPGKYVIRLDAGAGHRAKATFTVPGFVNDLPPENPTTTDPSSERARRPVQAQASLAQHLDLNSSQTPAVVEVMIRPGSGGIGDARAPDV